MLNQLDTMITEYVALAAELRCKASVVSALMGSREDEKHPAHKAFYDAVLTWTEQFMATQPSQPELVQALELLLLSADAHKNTAAFWYLTAIQSHGKTLIPLLEKPQRDMLRKRYLAAYPKRTQLPIQEQICQLLGGKGKKRLFL